MKVRIKHRLDGETWGCVLSDCEVYRYALWRIWDKDNPLWMMVMMNPSKATEEASDPTVTRQVKRARMNDAGGLVVVNCAAVRATDPEDAIAHPEPIGPENYNWIKWLIPACATHIAAWGAVSKIMDWDKPIIRILDECKVELKALDFMKSGTPRHPLYLPYDAKPKPYLREDLL